MRKWQSVKRALAMFANAPAAERSCSRQASLDLEYSRRETRHEDGNHWNELWQCAQMRWLLEALFLDKTIRFPVLTAGDTA